MDDLDSLFEGELASINQVFQEFEVKDKKKEQRTKTEEEDLKQAHLKVSNPRGIVSHRQLLSAERQMYGYHIIWNKSYCVVT